MFRGRPDTLSTSCCCSCVGACLGVLLLLFLLLHAHRSHGSNKQLGQNSMFQVKFTWCCCKHKHMLSIGYPTQLQAVCHCQQPQRSSHHTGLPPRPVHATCWATCLLILGLTSDRTGSVVKCQDACNTRSHAGESGFNPSSPELFHLPV